MIAFLADENLNTTVILALRHRLPGIDLVRAIDVGLTGVDDETLLAWAATENRVLLTHDISTMQAFAMERVAAGLQMPGVLEIPERAQLRLVVDDLELISVHATPDELADRTFFLPL